MSNPLIDKFYELHPEKKEKPKLKLPRIEDYEGEKTIADEMKEEKDTLNKYLENLNFPRVPPQSVPISNTGITAANPYPKLTSYEPTEDAFLDVAGKVQRGDAKVVSMHMNMEHFRKSYTFEVQVVN